MVLDPSSVQKGGNFLNLLRRFHGDSLAIIKQFSGEEEVKGLGRRNLQWKISSSSTETSDMVLDLYFNISTPVLHNDPYHNLETIKDLRGNSKDAGPASPAAHLRDAFYRMGLNDQEIVALSGALTLGRSRPECSGWGKSETKYTKDGPGEPGGQSWTVQWLKFNNSYFKDIKEAKDEDLLVWPSSAALFDDPSFKVFAENHVEDQDAFFEEYAKLSSLGGSNLILQRGSLYRSST